MIKLRVEWHRTCPGCGTALVVDFLDESADLVACPWCGAECGHGCSDGNGELRKYVSRAVLEIETKANGSTAVVL